MKKTSSNLTEIKSLIENTKMLQLRFRLDCNPMYLGSYPGC